MNCQNVISLASFLHPATFFFSLSFKFSSFLIKMKTTKKSKIASHCWWLLLGSFGHELPKKKEMLFLCLFFKIHQYVSLNYSNFLLSFFVKMIFFYKLSKEEEKNILMPIWKNNSELSRKARIFMCRVKICSWKKYKHENQVKNFYVQNFKRHLNCAIFILYARSLILESVG